MTHCVNLLVVDDNLFNKITQIEITNKGELTSRGFSGGNYWMSKGWEKPFWLLFLFSRRRQAEQTNLHVLQHYCCLFSKGTTLSRNDYWMRTGWENPFWNVSFSLSFLKILSKDIRLNPFWIFLLDSIKISWITSIFLEVSGAWFPKIEHNREIIIGRQQFEPFLIAYHFFKAKLTRAAKPSCYILIKVLVPIFQRQMKIVHQFN